jgi:hypothetical protein
MVIRALNLTPSHGPVLSSDPSAPSPSLSRSLNGIGPDGAAALSTSLAGLTSMQALNIGCGRPPPQNPPPPRLPCSARVAGRGSAGRLLPAAAAARLASPPAPSPLHSPRPPLALPLVSAGAPAPFLPPSLGSLVRRSPSPTDRPWHRTLYLAPCLASSLPSSFATPPRLPPPPPAARSQWGSLDVR